MTRPLDVSGQKFNRLTGVRPTSRGRWIFRCECGSEIEAKAAAVKFGNTKSCGCLNLDKIRERSTTHGMRNHPLYQLWAGMHARCKRHPEYAGRGIKVCDRWQNFANFVADMGERPKGMTLDRKDVNGNYDPNNCRWATRLEQAENTTRNAYLECDGVKMTVSQWSRQLGVDQRTLNRRRSIGWTDEEVIKTPIGAKRA